MPPKKKSKKVKEEVEPEDEYMKMDYKTLGTNLEQLKEKYGDIKSKRNYI
jgi:chaperonin cofactor prefoldin